GASVSKSGDAVTIGGLDPLSIKECEINCRESGSTLRFLLPLCLMSGERVTLYGTEKLISRPLDEYEALCRERGFTFERLPDHISASGRLSPGEYAVSMSKSSQFATGLLFALSTLRGESRIVVPRGAESVSYADMTLGVMRDFGVDAWKFENGYIVKGGSAYKGSEYTVEGDFSGAAFLDALNVVGGSVTVEGLKKDSLQGDRVYKKLFDDIASGREVDVSDCPDLAPILFAVASYAGGGKIAGTRRLKYKESDRVSSMMSELSAFGITLEDSGDSVSVSGKLHAPSRTLGSWNDHRVAMSLAVLCTVTGGVIDGAECVAKSYPGFFEDIEKLGIEVEYYGT
ncbi:MAG: 3-phosphoshikimate 1-carboxyvinyltransferase, partial [Clostridia bacterium]|nr:3-phosphoshikimate 1-carboxyvinyltransferase [Clostridia bacterium]